MQIDIHGPQNVLEQIRLLFEDQLEKNGYKEGPKFTSVETGVLLNYTKGKTILSIQLTEETETGDSNLRVETETEVAGLFELWDAALIAYGKEELKLLNEFAIDKDRVKQALLEK